MTGASAQETQEQIRQIQQQPLHPMAAGGSYGPPPSPPPLPIQSANTQGYFKTRGMPVNVGRLSLLGISFSLMFFGALTFLGGFLLGIWFVEPSISPNINEKSAGVGLLPLQQSPSPPQNAIIPSQNGQVIQNLAGRAGEIAQSTISNTPIPNVPSFLVPLVTTAQSTAGQQLGSTVQQQIHLQTNQTSPSSSQHSAPPEYQRRAPYHPQSRSSSTLPLEQPPLPVVTPQHGLPSEMPTPEQTISSSRGENENFTIQLGVYASKENAFSLVNDLQALNFISYITESKAPDGTPLYYVHSGHYKDYTTALEAASQFASQNIPGAIIVKVSQKNTSAS